MQAQEQQSKLEKKQALLAWKSQLRIRKLENRDIEEALDLVVESTVKLSQVFIELGIEKEVCRKAFRPDFEDEINQQNSIVVLDPSQDNKIIAVRIFRDLTLIDQSPPEKENFTCMNYYEKAKLNYELMKPIFEKEFQPKDYEITLLVNIHPDYASKGITDMINAAYARSTYSRGVKKTINFLYSEIMIHILMKLKVANPQILNEVVLEGREINGEFPFKKSKRAIVQSLDMNEALMHYFGVQDVIEERKQKLQKIQNKSRIGQQPRL